MLSRDVLEGNLSDTEEAEVLEELPRLTGILWELSS